MRRKAIIFISKYFNGVSLRNRSILKILQERQKTNRRCSTKSDQLTTKFYTYHEVGSKNFFFVVDYFFVVHLRYFLLH